MKRYGTLFLFPFLVILIFSFLSGFGYQSNQEAVKSMLMERTSILQQVYYGHMSRDEGELTLAHIETQPLLSEDILSFRETEYTEIDVVNQMEILSINEITKLNRYLSCHTKISWYMKGMNGNYKEVVEYHVVLKDTGKGYKISEFYPLET